MFEVLISGQKAKSSRQKNHGLPTALCQLPTLRTELEKIANRPITLDLTSSFHFFEPVNFSEKLVI